MPLAATFLVLAMGAQAASHVSDPEVVRAVSRKVVEVDVASEHAVMPGASVNVLATLTSREHLSFVNVVATTSGGHTTAILKVDADQLEAGVPTRVLVDVTADALAPPGSTDALTISVYGMHGEILGRGFTDIVIGAPLVSPGSCAVPWYGLGCGGMPFWGGYGGCSPCGGGFPWWGYGGYGYGLPYGAPYGYPYGYGYGGCGAPFWGGYPWYGYAPYAMGAPYPLDPIVFPTPIALNGTIPFPDAPYPIFGDQAIPLPVMPRPTPEPAPQPGEAPTASEPAPAYPYYSPYPTATTSPPPARNQTAE